MNLVTDVNSLGLSHLAHEVIDTCDKIHQSVHVDCRVKDYGERKSIFHRVVFANDKDADQCE